MKDVSKAMTRPFIICSLFFLMVMGSFVPQGKAQYHYLPYEFAGHNPGGINDSTDMASATFGQWRSLISNDSTLIWSSIDTIPFPFEFAGDTVEYFKVSNSGVLTFDTSAQSIPSTSNGSLPSSSVPDSSVLIWGLGMTDGQGKVLSKVFGTAPDRQYWVSFHWMVRPGTQQNFIWSIVFEEGSDRIHLVDQFGEAASLSPNGFLSAGIQVDSGTAFPIDGSPSLRTLAGINLEPSDNSYYTFFPDPAPSYDLSVTEEYQREIHPLDSAPFSFEVELGNYGAQTVSQADLNYRVDGGSVQSSSITFGGGLAPYEKDSIAHPVPWTPASAGTHRVEVWASDLDGNNDDRPSNDTLRFSIEIAQEEVLRRPLIEVFSSSNCGPCATMSDSLQNRIYSQRSRYTTIKYPTLTDPYATQKSEDRRRAYEVSGIPELFQDGVRPPGYYLSLAEFDSMRSRPAFMEIRFEEARYEGDSIYLEVRYEPLVNFHFPHLYYAGIAIVENRTYQHVGSNGQTEFHKTFMDMIPDEKGIPIDSLSQGDTLEIHRELDMSNSNVEEMDDLKAVAFFQKPVQNPFDHRYRDKDRHVYQSNWTDIEGTTGTRAFRPPRDGFAFSLYPNPSKGPVDLILKDVEANAFELKVFDEQGRLHVHKKFEGLRGSDPRVRNLDLSELASGIYYVQLRAEDHQGGRKLILR